MSQNFLHLDRITLHMAELSLCANFTLPKSGKIGVFGPSGAGKSTFFSLLAGFLRPNQGDLRIEGVSILEQSPSQRPISLVFQSHNLFAHLNVMQNIALGARGRKVEHDKIRILIKDLGLSGLENRKPREISGGEALRVAIARALYDNQDIWLMDEPFSALGPALSREIREMIDQILKEKPRLILLSDHNPNQLRDWVDYVIWVNEGKISSPIQTQDFFKAPPSAASMYL